MPGTQDTKVNGTDIVFVLTEFTSSGSYLSLALYKISSCAFVELYFSFRNLGNVNLLLKIPPSHECQKKLDMYTFYCNDDIEYFVQIFSLQRVNFSVF